MKPRHSLAEIQRGFLIMETGFCSLQKKSNLHLCSHFSNEKDWNNILFSPDFASHCMLMVLVSQSNNEKVTGIIEKDVRRGICCKVGWSLVIMCNCLCCQAGCRGTPSEGTAESEPSAAGWTHMVSTGGCSLMCLGELHPSIVPVVCALSGCLSEEWAELLAWLPSGARGVSSSLPHALPGTCQQSGRTFGTCWQCALQHWVSWNAGGRFLPCQQVSLRE